MQAISELNPRGGETDIADALRLAEREMATNGRLGLPHLFVLVTDGFANIEADQTLIEANKTRASGTAIVCIGITASINQNELINIAGTASRVFTVDTFQVCFFLFWFYCVSFRFNQMLLFSIESQH